MESAQNAGNDWKRVCDVASRLLDAPREDWDAILTRACGPDAGLRSRILAVCDNYSEDDEFLGAPMVSPLALEDPLAGQRIGPWVILGFLGEGGMGQVYLVERADGVFTQRAALKLTRDFPDAESLRRFHEERRIVAMLEHPSIARAIDGGATQSGLPYLVMEYVEGGCPIDEFRPEQTIRQKIRLFLQVVKAVEAAHRQRIAHRDLKPSNILVTPNGLPKVVDFGIAKLFEDNEQSLNLTHAAHARLTPTYASPEQLLREPSSLASDIYSLGAVLYKMLTGRPPHDLTDLNILQSTRLVTETDATAASAYGRDVDADLDAIVLKALERHPGRRYASATELAADLGRYLDGVPVEARAGALGHRARRFVRRHRGGVAAAAVCLTVLAGAGAKAIRDRQLENRRLELVRQTAGPVIADYESQLRKMSGSTALRDRIAENEKRYLNGIYADAVKDPGLRRQAAAAYGSLAYFETDKLAARDSLQKSLGLWRAILQEKATDAERLQTAEVLRHLGWSQIDAGKLTEAKVSLDESLRLLDSLTGTKDQPAVRRERVVLLFELSRVAAWAGKGPAAIDFAKKAVAEQETLPADPLSSHGIALTRMQLADVADTYGSGDPKLLAEALRQTRLAVASVRQAPACVEWSCREVKAAVLTRAPIIYIHQGLIQEALGLRDGLDLAEELLAEDPGHSGAKTSLRLGLTYLGWILDDVGRLDEALRMRRRLLEISVVAGRNIGTPKARLDEAIACMEVGRTLVRMKRLQEAKGYFDRSAEILAHPPATESVYWFMRQADIHRDLGRLYEATGQPAAARAEFAEQSAAAERFLASTGSALAKQNEADAHYLQGQALMAVDKAAGCALLRSSLERLAELKKATGATNRFREETAEGVATAIRGCE